MQPQWHESTLKHGHQRATAANYLRLYLVMYTMIAASAHFHFNLNNVYMTLMMVAPMALVMLVSMHAMFRSPRANLATCAVAVLAFALSFVGMRTQSGISDAEFLRSMRSRIIPERS